MILDLGRYLSFMVLGRRAPRRARRVNLKLTGPVRDEDYKAWVRSLPCLVCARTPSEPAHTGGHSMDEKASDLNCVPLCWRHHVELHRGVRAFQVRYGLDLARIVAWLNGRYRELGDDSTDVDRAEGEMLAAFYADVQRRGPVSEVGEDELEYRRRWA